MGMDSPDGRQAPCWGRHPIPEGRSARVRMGPLTLWIRHATHEWRIAWDRATDPMIMDMGIEVSADPGEPPAEAEGVRVAGEHSADVITLAPATADRGVVVRPEGPFHVPGRADVVMYVSTPLWARIQSGDAGGTLIELPTFRPTDSWFGPNTREGTLCYGSKTAARLRLDELSFHLARTISRIRIRNAAAKPFVVERINLPVPQLSLWVDGAGVHWTPSLDLVREEDGDKGRVDIAPRPPEEAGEVTYVADPREAPSRSVMARTIGALFA